MDTHTSSEEKSIRELISDLTTKSNDLIRKEIRLAKLEVSEALHALGTAATSFAIGGVLAFGGFLVLLAAAVLGLDLVIGQPALSALIVGIVVAGAGAAIALNGKRALASEKLGPDKLAPSLERDVELVQKHI
jgi:hypothetical protein